MGSENPDCRRSSAAPASPSTPPAAPPPVLSPASSVGGGVVSSCVLVRRFSQSHERAATDPATRLLSKEQTQRRGRLRHPRAGFHFLSRGRLQVAL